MVRKFVSRGGEKLDRALDVFSVDVGGLICADFGSHVGGFVDCLLQRGAERVHSVDTAYGLLAWKLRRDARVIVHERTNAMHCELPESVALLTIDAGWTRQIRILSNARRALTMDGKVITLIKPHYEVGIARSVKGVLSDDEADEVVNHVLRAICDEGWNVLSTTDSPVRGHGGNKEVFALLTTPS